MSGLMHPDVPRWAREVLEREVADVPFTDFHVLKDGLVQKLAVGRTATETYVVQHTPAGGEIYRIATRSASASPDPARDAPAIACRACGTAFRYWRVNGGDRPIYCFSCGAAVKANGNGPGTGHAEAPLTEEKHAARSP